MSEKETWLYWRNKLTGEHVMTLSNAYSEYPDWEMTTREGYLACPAQEPEPQYDPGAEADWKRDNEREAFVLRESPERAAGEVLAKADYLAQFRPGAIDSVEGTVVEAGQVIKALQAELETARRELQAAREALEPFAVLASAILKDVAKQPHFNGDSSSAFVMQGAWITYGQLRKALTTWKAQAAGDSEGSGE